MDYNKTINLPKTDFPMRAGLPSFPPRSKSPFLAGRGRPDTSSDQKTGERLLRKPSCI